MNLLRKYIRVLVEATEYDDKFKELMDSGYDGIKQAMELADSLGIASQELPWDQESIDEYAWEMRDDVPWPEVLEPTGWTKKDYRDAFDAKWKSTPGAQPHWDLRESTEQSATDEERDKMLYLFFAESSRMGIQMAEMLMPEMAKELVEFMDMVDMFIEMGESLISQKKAGDYGSLARLRSIWFEIRTTSTKMAKRQSGKVVDAEYLWSNDLSGVFGAIDMVLSSTFITWDPEHQELLDDLKEWAR